MKLTIGGMSMARLQGLGIGVNLAIVISSLLALFGKH